MEGARSMKEVYHIVEREGTKPIWTRVGIGFVNKDDSINIRLDSLPIDGRLHVRDMRPNTHRKEP